MGKTRKVYSEKFREQMIRLVRSGRTAEDLGREFEPSSQAIRNWVKQSELDEGKRTDGLKTDELEELARLRRENVRLKEEREILSKAAAWFAQETQSSSLQPGCPRHGPQYECPFEGRDGSVASPGSLGRSIDDRPQASAEVAHEE